MTEEILIETKIKTARESKGLSQIAVVERLAEKGISMSRETLSKIENGNRSISALELNALCKVLSIDISSFFADEADNDLVTLFRQRNVSEKTTEEVEKLQDMMTIFVYQRKIYNGEFSPQKRKPLWEECQNC